ncbi:MAG: transglycosylase SLT domain-containing protein [Deltaproteobacteria bacterium]|nr:transglycosylase SLT domain-containing protein [Deltaproteobacteria bacterium]
MRRHRVTVVNYSLSVVATALALSASSCSFNRGAALEVPATAAQRTEAAGLTQEVDGACRPQECFGSAIALLRSGEAERAKLGLTELADRYPDTVWAARASFVLADFAIEEGSREALGLLEDASTLTDIGDYILLNKARALKNSGLLDASLAAYGSLDTLYPDSVLRAEARFRKAVALMEAGDYTRARRAFSDFIRDFPDNILVPDALLDSAVSSIVLNETTEAVKAANAILVRYPAHPLARYAESIVSRLKKDASAPELTTEERFMRADRLFANARYNDAAAEYAYIAKNAGERERQRSTFRLAVTQVRLKKYDLAEKTLNGYLGLREPEREREALYWLAFTAARQGKEELLGDTGKRLGVKYPKSAERARAMLLLANLYQGRARQDKAVSIFRQVVNEFGETDASDEALWSIGWSAYRAGRYPEAFKSFQSYRDTNPKGKRKGQFLYWSGRSLEKTGRGKEAAAYYNRVCAADPAYYCQMSRGRLDAINGINIKAALTPPEPMAPNGAQTADVTAEAQRNDDFYADGRNERTDDRGADPQEDPRSELSLDVHYLAARELLILALPASASKELSVLTSMYTDDPESLQDLAGLFYQAEDYYSALRIYYDYLSKTDPHERTDAATELRAYSFPPGLVESVRHKAPAGVDPCLVAAVMREESSFNPKAVSVTGALGLMQIMPSTGMFVAKELGRAGFEPKELLNPETNIRIGSWYLWYLGRKYNNDIVLTIAGYNAGPGAVKRWQETLPSEFDEFIESIPYTETRNYAKRVLKSYNEFRRASGTAFRQGAAIPDILIQKKSPAAFGRADKERS